MSSSCRKCREHYFGMFQAFMYEYPDEGRRYRWSLADAQEAIARHAVQPQLLAVAGLAPWFNGDRVEIDQQHLPHVDMEKPAIILLRVNGAIVLDGNHRLYRAFTSGPENFPVYFLNDQQLKPFQVEPIV